MRQGIFHIRGGKPFELIDEQELAIPRSGLDVEAASVVAKAVKVYLKTAHELLSGRYACFNDIAPPYLRGPSSVVVVQCSDGVIVRYDSAVGPEPRYVAANSGHDLIAAAPIFSERVLFLGDTPDGVLVTDPSQTVTYTSTPIDGEPSVMLRHHIAVAGTTQHPVGFMQPSPPCRPLPVVSIRNEFTIRVLGQLLEEQPAETRATNESDYFVAESPVRLNVGWEALEVYPLLAAEHWNVANAPLWAELDILSVAAQHNLRREQLHRLDPRADLRQQYARLLLHFEALLDGPEEPAHQFLREHPELICPTHERMWSKLPFRRDSDEAGYFVSDFVFREPVNDYLLVEIEAPYRGVFRHDGQQRHEVTHAIKQVLDWIGFIQDNKEYVQRTMGLEGISSTPRGMIVIGRSNLLGTLERRNLALLNGSHPSIQIVTYDDVLARARALLQRLVGPLMLAGENVRLYVTRGVEPPKQF